MRPTDSRDTWINLETHFNRSLNLKNGLLLHFPPGDPESLTWESVWHMILSVECVVTPLSFWVVGDHSQRSLISQTWVKGCLTDWYWMRGVWHDKHKTNTNTTDVHHGKEQKRLQKPQRCIVVRNNPKDTEVHSGKKRHKETHLETKELKRVVLSNLTTYRDHVYHYPSWMVSQFLCNFYLLFYSELSKTVSYYS